MDKRSLINCFNPVSNRDLYWELINYKEKCNSSLIRERNKNKDELYKILVGKNVYGENIFNKALKAYDITLDEYNYYVKNNFIERIIDAIYYDDLEEVMNLYESSLKYNDYKHKLISIYYFIVNQELEKASELIIKLYNEFNNLNFNEQEIFHFLIITFKYELGQLDECYEIIRLLRNKDFISKKIKSLFYLISSHITFDIGFYFQSFYYSNKSIEVSNAYINQNLRLYNFHNLIKIYFFKDELYLANQLLSKHKDVFSIDALFLYEILLNPNKNNDLKKILSEVEGYEHIKELILLKCIIKDREIITEEDLEYIKQLNYDKGVLFDSIIELYLKYYELPFDKFERYYFKYHIKDFLRDNEIHNVIMLNEVYMNILYFSKKKINYYYEVKKIIQNKKLGY